MEKKIVKMKLSDIIPYERNPRKNKKAVKAVSESIRQTGYNNPIIVDENGVILAGHTRRLSLLERGYEEAEVLRVTGLSEENKRKFRLLDNKAGEYSTWDFVALSEELATLDFEDLELDWGICTDWSDEEDDQKKEKSRGKEYICQECGFHFTA